MIGDETKPENFRNERGGDHSHIKGWGVDRDPKNDPTYPMKHRTDEEIEGYTWERPEQQPVDIEVLKSVERPNIPAVFGTSVPPSGLSGAIRRLAFKYSESSYGRWLPLVMADRVGEIEGIIEDLKHGHVPNIFAEKGMRSEWKYNRKTFVIKTAVTVAAAVGAYLLLTRNKKD
ncbi:hypothetical protein [Salinimicrobium xinjiangense]|uniref:hypothetical protein n=1 Tax=Salinimicrobium xinjiangense TaxID=438596 RepID=UPI00040EE63D|nr:hypothetical protein [Salinimicrobium xinjiangense]